jgi:hypothetical protein
MPTASKVPLQALSGRGRFVRRVLAALAVVTASLLLGAAGYAIYLHRIATLLVASAREIQTTEDALHKVNIWKNRWGVDSWTDSYDSGRGTMHWVQVSNRGIARVHLAPWSALRMRVLLYDTKLIQVLVEIYTPSAAAVAEERFKPGMSENFYLGQIKAAVPTARVEFPSSMTDAQKETAFAFRIKCLLVPGLCATPEDVLPIIKTLDSSTTPD